MKAIVSAEPGVAKLRLEHLPQPVPGPGQLLIRTAACGANYPDALIVEDRYQWKPPRPFVPASEVAGIVEAVGEGVTTFEIGDRVLTALGIGGFAQYGVADAAKCLLVPTEMPLDIAAVFMTTYGTSYHALKQRAGLRAGETLLVLGAAGGVGLAAVEIGRTMGAHVVAGVSTPEKAALACKMGADHAFVYSPDADAKTLAALFKAEVGGTGADVIYDPVGGAYAEAGVRCLAWNGRFLIIGFPAGIASIPLNLPLLKGSALVGVFYGSFCEREPEANAVNNDELMALYRRGALKPHISHRLPLAEGAHALGLLLDRKATGKIVVVNEDA